jgi:hypothetical protein
MALKRGDVSIIVQLKIGERRKVEVSSRRGLRAESQKMCGLDVEMDMPCQDERVLCRAGTGMTPAQSHTHTHTHTHTHVHVPSTSCRKVSGVGQVFLNAPFRGL